jgi:hypothetical protein
MKTGAPYLKLVLQRTAEGVLRNRAKISYKAISDLLHHSNQEVTKLAAPYMINKVPCTFQLYEITNFLSVATLDLFLQI